MGAFFADIREPIVGKVEPGMLVAIPEQEAKLAEYDATAKALQARLDTSTPELVTAQEEWEESIASTPASNPTWTTLSPAELAAEKGAVLERDAGDVIRSTPGAEGAEVFK